MYFKNKVIAIVPAAGIGKRMLSDIPKQYIRINGQTIIEHSLKVLIQHSKINNIIVIINKHDKTFHRLPISKNKKLNVIIIKKKNKRCHSVYLGVKIAAKYFGMNNWVLIHDAVRPCVKNEDISKLLSFCFQNIGSILAIPIFNTIKYSFNKNTIDYTVPRNFLWQALTPQLFPIKLLIRCLNKTIKKHIFITDESSALEYCGYKPHLVIGKSCNIKITTQEDLNLAKFYLKKK